MIFVSLRSGSYGNGYLISDGKTTLMFDAGVPVKLVRDALSKHSLPKPSHIFISHEHGDHVKNLDVLLRALSPETYVVANRATMGAMRRFAARPMEVENNSDVTVGGFVVRLTPKPHDAVSPVGFRIEHSNGTSAAIVTDLGHPHPDVLTGVSEVNFLLIESNYDPEMLLKGPYPQYLRERVDGHKGHLSNQQCRSFLECFIHDKLNEVMLGHISEQNNHPELALKCIAEILPRHVKLSVALRYDPVCCELRPGGMNRLF